MTCLARGVHRYKDDKVFAMVATTAYWDDGKATSRLTLLVENNVPNFYTTGLVLFSVMGDGDSLLESTEKAFDAARLKDGRLANVPYPSFENRNGWSYEDDRPNP